ncbi:MAG: peptidase C25, partial [Bacteroidales bacterium]|nr:peptidase C25 [Bacteroidales bacterium]
MKRLLFLVVLCAMCSFAFSQNGRIPLTPTTQRSALLQSNSMSGFSTTFSFNSIESNAISNEKGDFSEIYIDGSFPYGEVGSPSLPMITRMIAIPQGATPVVTVNGYSESEYTLADYDINTLSAQQAPVRKDVDPTSVEYVVNESAYSRDTYTTDEIASVEYLGTMRGIRIGKLTIRPVAYNAAAKTVKVYNDVNVTVSFENADAGLTQSMFASTYSPAFNSIYDQLLNKSIFGQSTVRDAYTDHPDPYNTPVRMLVICYSGFRDNSSLNQWLQWKLQKGYYVDIFYTDETGTTANSIKSFIQTKYNASVSAGNAYSYLIVIGDTGQVPQYMTKNIDSSIGNCASDLGYAAVNFTTSSTSNYFPDMLYSRISVENATHLANYIEKVLVYEKYQMSDGGDYLNNLILVGGWDSSWTSRVARPTVNYGSNNYFNTSNTTYGGFENGTLNITISTSSTQGYSGTNNGCYNGINNGVGFLNYTAHGDKQEWYQPKLSAAEVATLTNNGKYFFGVGNCCLTGNFNNTTTDYSPGSAIGTNACFAETMIRVPKAGAVAYVGCSPYSYWYEDFYWAVGAHSYSQGNAPSTSASTMGVYDAMFVDGYWNSASSLLYLGNLAVQQAVTAGNTTSSITDGNCNNSAHYYFQFYHTFGDGSVMPYVTKPEANNVTLPASVMAGATSMTVNAVAGSYVAVTDNESTIYGVAVANASGVATVNFTEAIPGSGTLYVVVTRQQYQPYF